MSRNAAIMTQKLSGENHGWIHARKRVGGSARFMEIVGNFWVFSWIGSLRNGRLGDGIWLEDLDLAWNWFESALWRLGPDL